MSKTMLYPTLALTALEEECDPASFVIAGQIDCPQVHGRRGAFVRDSKGNVQAHLHLEHLKCERKADVYLVGTAPEGHKRYRSVCWTKDEKGEDVPEHVHDFDEKTFETLKTEVDVLRYRGN